MTFVVAHHARYICCSAAVLVPLAFALGMAAPSQADETLTVASAHGVAPRSGETRSRHVSTTSTASAVPSTRSNRHKDPRHFPAFGPVSIAGATYYTYRFEGHVHTQYSRDAKHPPVEILQAAQELGLDALVITDHGSSAARHDFPNYQGTLTPFVGREIGGDFGHAVIWNVAADAEQGAQASLQNRARFAHEHGGLLIFAHPGWWIDGNGRDPMDWMTPQALRRGGPAGDVDAIELWNGVYRTPLPRLIAAWEKLLEAGVFVPIVGNSDFHRFGVHQLGNAHNLAVCDRPEIATCLWPAVREGRIIVTDGPAAVVSVNNRLPGSIIDADGSPLHVDVDALAPEGGTLQVHLGRQVTHTLELQPGIRAKASWQIPSPATDSYVRIDILRPNRTLSQTPVSLLSNPVLIDVPPKRSAWR